MVEALAALDLQWGVWSVIVSVSGLVVVVAVAALRRVPSVDCRIPRWLGLVAWAGVVGYLSVGWFTLAVDQHAAGPVVP